MEKTPMMSRFSIAALSAAALVATSTGAFADPVDASVLLNQSLFGTASSTVAYDPAAPTSNFGSPGATAQVGYSVYLRADATNFYGLFAAAPGGGSPLPFANIYLDLDPVTEADPGSDLGFELTNHRAFIPGVDGYADTPEISAAVSSDNSEIGFAIPISDLTGPIAGLSYYSPQDFIGPNNPYVVLRLSQTFSYSVAGGASYGPDRLGAAVLVDTAVPEPASLTVLGAAVLGMAGLRRRRRAASQR